MRILTGIDVSFKPFGGSLIGCNDLYSNPPEPTKIRFLTLPPTDGKKWWSMEDVIMMNIQKPTRVEDFFAYTEKLSDLVEEQMRSFKPDIIHCQHLNFGLSRVFADLSTDVPKIGICHGTDVQLATTNTFFLENLKVIADAMDFLLFPSDNMAQDFFAVYGKVKPYMINSYGIPDSYYGARGRRQKFEGKGTLRILYAGRLLSWKGADIAVSAMKYIEKDVHLTVIGDEDEKGYLEKMLAFVKEHKLNGRVEFQKQLPRGELLETFYNYDAIVFPSTKLEAFSITTIEAQTTGLPVIYAPAGGIINAVQDSGIKVSENSPQNWASLLDHIYMNPSILGDLRRNGYKNAERFRLSESKKRLFDISSLLISN